MKKSLDIESKLFLALFVFCSGGSTVVQLPLTKYKIYLALSKICQRVEIYPNVFFSCALFFDRFNYAFGKACNALNF